MIRILIIDDNQFKANKITEVLNSIPGCRFELAADLVSSRRLLFNYFDLLILDMNLPERFDEIPKENKGIEFIKEIKSSRRLKLPGHIIGLTEYSELVVRYKQEFEDNLLSLIKYEEKGTEWKNMLNDKINHLITSELQRLSDASYDFDIAFITALRTPELESLLQLDYQWTELKKPNDSSKYYIGKIKISDGQTLNVVATYLPQMGMVATATSATKIINSFKPKYVIMTGICGGIEGKVQLGDIIIADLSFDFGSGKVVKGPDSSELFEPDFKSIPLSSYLKEELLDLTTKKDVLSKIKNSWQGDTIKGELSLHVGPVGSGAGVIANASFASKIITNQRKLLAVDMETYSIFYCCSYANDPKPIALSIKSVSDLADENKNDNIQKFCSFTSSRLADHIIRNIIKI